MVMASFVMTRGLYRDVNELIRSLATLQGNSYLTMTYISGCRIRHGMYSLVNTELSLPF